MQSELITKTESGNYRQLQPGERIEIGDEVFQWNASSTYKPDGTVNGEWVKVCDGVLFHKVTNVNLNVAFPSTYYRRPIE